MSGRANSPRTSTKGSLASVTSTRASTKASNASLGDDSTACPDEEAEGVLAPQWPQKTSKSAKRRLRRLKLLVAFKTPRGDATFQDTRTEAANHVTRIASVPRGVTSGAGAVNGPSFDACQSRQASKPSRSLPPAVRLSLDTAIAEGSPHAKRSQAQELLTSSYAFGGALAPPRASTPVSPAARRRQQDPMPKDDTVTTGSFEPTGCGESSETCADRQSGAFRSLASSGMQQAASSMSSSSNMTPSGPLSLASAIPKQALQPPGYPTIMVMPAQCPSSPSVYPPDALSAQHLQGTALSKNSGYYPDVSSPLFDGGISSSGLSPHSILESIVNPDAGADALRSWLEGGGLRSSPCSAVAAAQLWAAAPAVYED